MSAFCPRNSLFARVFGFGKKRQAPADAFVDALFVSHSGPAFLLDSAHRVLRTNTPGARLLAGRGDASAPLPTRLGSSDMHAFLSAQTRDNPALTAEILLRRAPFPDLWFSASTVALPVATGRRLLLLIDISRLKFLENVHREFIANVSHDLRTPIAILKGYADTLKTDYAILDDTDRSRFIARIHDNIRRLGTLVEDMLLLVNLDETPDATTEFTTNTLNATLNDAAEMFADRAAQHQIAIHTDLTADDSATPVCAPRFLNAAINIIENTFHHAATATTIRIASSNLPTGATVVEIADDGVGIAENDITRVFDRFFRADKSRTREKGSGLGLSIVRRIMELHSGNASARLNRPHGFVIRLEFPPPKTDEEKRAAEA
ncbi:MAG: HAMP domain-containing histidine kinase [Puniceicoccales bacterium]|nr:HAMP domain-containing histidine kinase [Puniceicoccales bacterium]